MPRHVVPVGFVLGACIACSTDAARGGRADGGADAESPPAVPTRPVASPPSYLGTRDNAAPCDTEYPTIGFEPVDVTPARHPLFLYFVGTSFFADDVSSRADSPAPRAVTEAMARRGFVALSVQYDNGATAWLSDHENQLGCLFAASKQGNVLAAACGLPNVDCALGVATWGHSQGGLVAHLAANYEPRVRAVWTTGYGGDDRATLATDRLRVVAGEGDTANADVARLNATSGFTDAECPNDGRKECLRGDGSGWIIVLKSDCAVTSADHCWFDKASCLGALALEPNWIDPASTKPFALESNADWVAATVRRP